MSDQQPPVRMLFICSQNKWRSPSAEALFAQVNGVSESFGAALHPANRVDATTTLNILVGRGAGTEWHRDANPVSSLLFATSLQPDNGGEFQFRPSDGQLCEIRPCAGVFVCFDGSCEHHVAHLKPRRGGFISQ